MANAKKKTSNTIATFDFEEQAQATATLDDLLFRINVEQDKLNGELATSRTLKRTLDFLQSAIGLVVSLKDEPLPIPALKTVKLLFLADANNSRNVIALLTAPQRGDDATMEFSTVTTIPRDREASAIVESLIDSLSKEIAPDRLRMFSALMGDLQDHSVAERLILLAERTGDEVFHTLSEVLSGDEVALSDAFRGLTTLLDNFRVSRSDKHDAPANEALYVHLQTLGFHHYALHYPQYMEQTRICGELAAIEAEADALCRFAAGSDPHHGPDKRVFSVSTVRSLIQAWPKEIAALIAKTTGFATSIKQLKGNQDRAKVLLASYALRSFDCDDLDAPILSVYDIVAALASFRYQQEAGHEYQPYWHGQVEQGKSPQRHFDKGLNCRGPHQHQGVMHVYLNRFYEYQAALTGTSASHRAWMQCQVAMLNAYRSILKLNDIMAIVMALTSLNFVCASYAKDCVLEHLIRRR